MSNIHALSAACKDAFVILNGAIRIEYRDGDSWELESKSGGLDEEKQTEHPCVKQLRAASMASITDDPPEIESEADGDMAMLLKTERVANNNLRDFLVKLDAELKEAGMPKTVVGEEVLTWLKGRLSAKSATE